MQKALPGTFILNFAFYVQIAVKALNELQIENMKTRKQASWGPEYFSSISFMDEFFKKMGIQVLVCIPIHNYHGSIIITRIFRSDSS